MKTSTAYNISMVVLMGVCLFFLSTVHAAPMESEDDQLENTMVAHSDGDGEMGAPWDPINTAALRKLLMQLDAEDRMGRAIRSWPQAEPRGWGLRALDGRVARQWRADKRQVRFRQCYFNPISCFRK